MPGSDSGNNVFTRLRPHDRRSQQTLPKNKKRSTISVAILFVLGLLILASIIAGFRWNFLWPITAVLSLIIGFGLSWAWRKSPEVKALPPFILAIVVLILFFADYLPRSGDEMTYSRVYIPIAGELSPEADYVIEAADIPHSEVIYNMEFEELYFTHLAHAREVEEAGILLSKALDIAESLRTKGNVISVELDDLDSAIDNLDSSLRNRFPTLGLDEIRAAISSLEGYLNRSLKQYRELPSEDRLDFLKNFYLQLLEYSLEAEYHDMIILQDKLNDVLDQATTSLVESDSSLKAIYNESAREWELEERITISTPETIKLTLIDASELRLESEIKDLEQQLYLSYGDPTDVVSIQNPSLISPNPYAPNVVIINRMLIEATDGVVSTRFRPTSIKYILLRWPTPFPANLGLVMDLSEYDLPWEHSYNLTLERDIPIKQVELPEYSYFASGMQFERKHTGELDILKPSKGDIRPSDFRTRNHIWIELLPDSIIFRNPLVQKYKEFLIFENAFVGLIIATFGTAFAAIFVKE